MTRAAPCVRTLPDRSATGAHSFSTPFNPSLTDSLAVFTICKPEAQAKSRIVGLRMAMMTLRLMEHWRLHLGTDHESALIVLAVAATTMEKFTRTTFDVDLQDIRATVPTEQLARCNVSSIASAVGINRETARRKVKRLVEAGILLKDSRGSLRISQDYTLRVATADMMQRQLTTLVQTANELLRDGILADSQL